MEKNRCACGKIMARWRSECKACAEIKHQRYVAEAVAIVATRKCPNCGGGLKRNNSMTGWWQCEQYGAVVFRKDQSKPACSFQIFTE